MKKVFTVLALVLLPLSVWAMTPVSDETLSDVSGQAGVTLIADLAMDISIGTLAWGDSNGIQGFNGGTGPTPWTTVPTGGYIGVTHFNITNMRLKARETDHYNGYYTSIMLKPITIDVATDTKMGVANTTFVRFGLGSLYVGMDAMALSVEMGPTHDLGQVLGTANLGPMEMYFNTASYIDIYSHAGCGVNFEFNIIIDQFNMSYMSWGDTDGLPGGEPGSPGGVGYWIGPATSAGYVGLGNLSVGGPIIITGTVAIDVVSVQGATYVGGVGVGGGGVSGGTGLAEVLGQKSSTIVHISFPTNFNVSVTGPITAEVKLDSVAALNSADAGTLGDIYMSGFNLNIRQGSWLGLTAH